MIPFYVSDIPLSCINSVATEFHVPAKLIIAIIATERGKKGEIVKNRNGSYDMGPMQVNSRWLPMLEKHGISMQEVRDNVCLNVRIGTFLLGKAIASESNLQQGIGNFNSHTPSFNHRYVQKVKLSYTKLNLVLNE